MTPKSETELAEMITAAQNPMRIQAGGTRPIGRPVAGDVLDISALSGVTLFEPGALTLVAQAGTPIGEIQALLDTENQRLAFEPMDHRALLGTTGTPTIGGVVSSNTSGPRRISVGACRDHMLGLRFVDGAGTILKNGGRVMKNVTGYDLVKLLTGAYGTLGVLSEVSLKVLPKTETSATLRIHGVAHAQAVEAMSAALGSPFEVTGAAYDGDVLVRIEGFSTSVAYRLEQLKTLLGGYGDLSSHDDAQTQTLWASIRDVEMFAGTDHDIWRVSLKPSDSPAFIARLNGAKTLSDWGGGLIWVSTPKGYDLRADMTGIAGHATLMRADDATREKIASFHPEDPVVSALSQQLRAKFDPRALFNQGLMA